MRQDRATGLPLLLAFVLTVALVTLAGCSSGVGDTDSGGVALVVSQFNGLPSQVSVNNAGAVGLVTVDQIQLQSIVENSSQGTSDLQTVELRTYEVQYSRADSGMRLPTPLVERLFSTVPPGGTSTFDNLPILRNEQLLNPPLSDLLFINGGFDRETGSEVIRLNFHIRFFGRTLGGRDVVSSTQSFTVDFVP